MKLVENYLSIGFIWPNKINTSFFNNLSKFTDKEIEIRSKNLISIYSEIKKNLAFHPLIKIKNEKKNDLNPKTSSQHKEMRILYVGASVTAQKNGYRSELNKLFEKNGNNVNEKVLAVGATGSLFGLCNLDNINKDKFDIGLYEYSTGDLNIGLTPMDLIYNTVKNSLILMAKSCKNLVVVHNYRSDFESDKGDIVRKHYNQAASELSIPILNVYKKVEEYKKTFNGDWTEIYRDNVHTGAIGSKIVAKFIFEMFEKCSFEKTLISENNVTLPKIHEIQIPGIKKEQYTYPSSGQEFNYYTLTKGKKLHFEMKGKFLGLIPIVGPKSGWLNLSINELPVLKYCLFDRHCHYTRVQPRYFEYKTDDFVHCSISLLEETVDIGICSKEHKEHNEKREISISSFIGEDLEIKNIYIGN